MKKKYLSKILSMTIAFALVFLSMDMTVLADEVYQEETLSEDLNENSDIQPLLIDRFSLDFFRVSEYNKSEFY